MGGWLSEQFVDHLNGKTFGIFDPRIRKITDPVTITGFPPFIGTVNGAGNSHLVIIRLKMKIILLLVLHGQVMLHQFLLLHLQNLNSLKLKRHYLPTQHGHILHL